MRACWPYTDPCGYMIVGLNSYGILIPMHGCNGLRWHGSKLVKGWLKNLEECLWRCILLDEIRIDGECPQDFKFRWHTWWSRTIIWIYFHTEIYRRTIGKNAGGVTLQTTNYHEDSDFEDNDWARRWRHHLVLDALLWLGGELLNVHIRHKIYSDP